MKAIIKLGYRCNDRCLFCHAADQKPAAAPTPELVAKIDLARALGHGIVVLSGGEPTVHPGFMDLAEHCYRRGIPLGLVTNGRRLADEGLVARLVELGLSYAYVSLHGPQAVHDEIVRAVAFEETIAALANLSKRDIDLTINCVVTERNLGRLREWVEVVSAFEGARLKLSMTEPKGAAQTDFDEIVPSVAAAASAAADAIAYAKCRFPTRRILHDGFPHCLLPGLEDRYDDLWTHGFTCMSEANEEGFFPVDDDNKVHPEICRGCRLEGPCPGLFKSYYERVGSSELRPRRGPRSNSFNLIPVAALPWRRGSPCPVRGRSGHLDRARTLFLRNGERLTLFRTRTRDFSRAELLSVKLETGQLYVDGSSKAAVDDFAADLKKIELLEPCLRCSELPACPGSYRVRSGDLFSKDDAFVRELLSGLRGEILDLGCGESPYSEILAPLACRGDIVYRGVDPDADLLERLRKKWPWARLETARAEDLRLQPGSLDHLTILRSYNHIERPEQVLPHLVAAMKPKGTLLIVDNVAFGLLRTPRRARKAESGSAHFEHHRNDTASEPAKLLDALGLLLLQRRDVGPATSNQWLLHYRKEDA